MESNDKLYWQENIDWLLERFPDCKYRDVIGLCKVATIEGEDGIKDQDYSLNPGRYVGVVLEEDGLTDTEFKDEMISLKNELLQLNASSQDLENKIINNLKLLVIGDE